MNRALASLQLRRIRLHGVSATKSRSGETMMRISVQIEGVMGLTWPAWKRLVTEVEAMGFAGLYCSDHFVFRGPPDRPSLDVFTALTYAASHSTKLLLGALVAPVSFRDPVELARQAIAIDDLSEGRYILGVGAGWNEREHAMFGYPLGDIPTRVRRFTEALAVMTLLIRSDDPVSFDGEFYHLHDAVLRPRPQRHTPVMIGGSGPKRTLPLVAKYGDIWNASGMTADEVRDRNALLDAELVKAGRQPADVPRTMMKFVLCGRNETEYAARVQGMRNMANLAPLSVAELVENARTSMKGIVGTPEEVAAGIGTYADAGIEEIMLQFFAVDDFDALRVLADDVLPLL